MIEIARLPADERQELFHNTAAKTGLHDAIVEKDFWVCLTLDYLFHRSPWRKAVTFKGGTSLSKGYHLINRFSEDIDLILDWRVLGYGINELVLCQEKVQIKHAFFKVGLPCQSFCFFV